MKNKEALIVFVKNAIKGKVKTRIAEDTSHHKAHEIYLELLGILYNRLLSVDQKILQFYSDHIEQNDLQHNIPYSKYLQNGHDIGARMSNAFELLFNEYDRLVLIGSDCPSIDKNIINEAFEQLNTNDIVIGPALDGGYYLIGMNKFYPEIFKDISWSTDLVFSQTVEKIVKANLILGTLTPLSDVDRIQDWQLFIQGMIKKPTD